MRGNNNTPDVIDSRESVLPFMDPVTLMNSQGEEATKPKGDASVVCISNHAFDGTTRQNEVRHGL
jgi:hypothetical protein